MIAPTSRRVIPAPSARFVDENGVIDDQWYGFLRALYTRTGGAIGNGVVIGQPPPDLTVLQASLAGLTVATADLPAVRVSLAATALALTDVQTLAAVQADPDPALDLTALQTTLAALTAATADLPAIRATLAATALTLADVQILAAVQESSSTDMLPGYTRPGGTPPAANPLLIDAISATVRGAYGSRKLRAAYVGPCLRMRRASDNTELDLGFAADGSMDSAAMLAFGGTSGSVYVTKWYDQSLSAQDMSQTVAAQQPNLLLNGVVAKLQNATNRPALLFNTTLVTSVFNTAFSFGAPNDKISVSAVGMNTASTGGYARLASFTATGQTEDYDSLGSACLILACAGNTTLGSYRHVLLANVAVTRNSPFQAVSSFDGTNYIITVNGTASTPSASTGSFATDGRMIFGTKVPGLNSGDQAWDGFIAEVIFAIGPISTGDQTIISASQRTYYGTP